MAKTFLTFEEAEEHAFNCWLNLKCPSGDVEDVQMQWEASNEYSDLLDEYNDSLGNS
jgi:hypothetical protein